MKIRKNAFILALVSLLIFAGCKGTIIDPTATGGNSGTGSDKNTNSDNPEPFNSRSKNLDFIFSTKSVGKVTITITRSQWNQMLTNYDYFYKNENSVKFESFEYEKDGYKWNLKKGGGIRLRGNTSRYRPQGKDFPTDNFGNTKPNYGWDDPVNGYYHAYSQTCSDDDYRQSHFKVDFEDFLPEEEEQKLAGCMKGVALKRMDGSCTKEIFCYDLFHRYGIWTAPRASHTRVFFKFIEDDGSVKTLDYGVYEMFEEVNKQSLKARDKDENKASNAWKNSKGNLWKCAGGDLSQPEVEYGCEDIRITEFDADGTPSDYKWYRPTYDLKTNKDNLEGATAEFKQFITELNNLPEITGAFDFSAIDATAAFYNKWFDVDFLLKTYAINNIVGMDDDYWGNANNYYLYFTDTPSNGRKVYLIPFDYDNTIGASIAGDHSSSDSNYKYEGIEHNPLKWNRGHNRPLMDKLMKVPEYRKIFIDYLVELSSANSEWNYEKCSQRWREYWNMVSPYLNSPDLDDHISTKGTYETVWKPSGYSLLNEGNNIYDYTRNCFLAWILSPTDSNAPKITFDLNGGTIIDNADSVSVTFAKDELVDITKLITPPKKPGFVFAGWTQTKNGEDYINYYAINGTLYAKWKLMGDIKDLYIYQLEEGMEEYDASYKGIQIKILNVPKFVEDGGKARVRQIFVNGEEVSHEDWRGSSMRSTVWRFPYTEKGKDYSINVKYLNPDYWSLLEQSNTIVVRADSGIGKFEITNNDIDFNVTNNVISFSPQPEIYVAGSKMGTPENNNVSCGYSFEFHDNDWKWSAYPWMDGYELKDFNLINWLYSKNDEAGKIPKVVENPVMLKSYFKINGNDIDGDYRINLNIKEKTFRLTDTGDPRPKVTVITDDAERPGVVLKFPLDKLFGDLSEDEIKYKYFTRQIRLNGVVVSDIRSYGPQPMIRVQNGEWYYPFVDAGKEYTFSVEYISEDWNNYCSLAAVTVTPTSGAGEVKIIQKPEYKVENNVITWTKQPVLQMGGQILTEEIFAGVNKDWGQMGYQQQLLTTNWNWCMDREDFTYNLSSYDITKYCVEERESENLDIMTSNNCFMKLIFFYGNNWTDDAYPYGRYEYEILADPDGTNFRLN